MGIKKKFDYHTSLFTMHLLSLQIFFINSGRASKDLESALIFSGGLTTYIEDPKENKSYNIVLQIDTQDLKTER
jgi:hypothetical protein